MKNRYFGIALLFVVSAVISCASKNEVTVEEIQNSPKVEEVSSASTVFDKVDRYPEFPGGMDGLAKFIQENLKYPEVAKTNEIEGRVLVEFVILKSGEIDAVVLKKGIGSGCDEAAIELIKSMPEWKPGMLNEKLVNVKLVLPIVYKMS